MKGECFVHFNTSQINNHKVQKDLRKVKKYSAAVFVPKFHFGTLDASGAQLGVLSETVNLRKVSGRKGNLLPR